jgi:hypothetical protein
MLANVVSIPVSKVYYKIVSDKRNAYDWPLLTGFFLVNTALMSFAAMLIFRIMQFQGLTDTARVAGILAFLAGGRWASMVAAHPVTDSLTILSIAAMVYGLLSQNRVLLSAAIIVGLLSKESFALFFPLVLLFSDRHLKVPVVLSMIVSLALYFGIKYRIDSLSVTSTQASLEQAFDTFKSVQASVIKIFSVKGFADIFSVYGFFSLIFISGLFYKEFRLRIKLAFNRLFIAFSLIILAHMLLSMELARMFFLGSAMFVPFLAKCFDIHPLFKNLHLNKG